MNSPIGLYRSDKHLVQREAEQTKLLIQAHENQHLSMPRVHLSTTACRVVPPGFIFRLRRERHELASDRTYVKYE